MKRAQRLAALCYSILSFTCSVNAGELAERKAVQDAAAGALYRTDYAFLESTTTNYRDSSSRFESGVWKLTFLYLGISNLAGWNRKDAEFWNQLSTLTSNWVKEHPGSPSAYIAHGIVLENHAWSVRGPGTADSVDPGSWKPFRERMITARDYLLEHREIAGQDPHWYVSMIRIGTALRDPKEEIMHLVSDASKRKPYYYQTYFAAVDYFSPKWGGNAQTLEEFVLFVVEKTRDDEGLGLYARIYWAALQSWYASQIWPAMNWLNFSSGVEDVIRRFPAQWNINNFARFACVAQDRPLTKRLIEAIDGQPIHEAWSEEGGFEACRNWALNN